MWLKALVLAIGGVLGAAFVTAPWTSPPPLTYETVSGWPMRVYFRNHGQGPERMIAVGGMPALSMDEPLSAQSLDEHFALVKAGLKSSPTVVKSGDFAWFEIDDPDELAWTESRIADRETFFYVFAVVEMPRASVFNRKWVSEVCMVARRAEAFKRCPEHNEVYPAS